MEDDGDAVDGGNGADVVGGGDGTGDRGLTLLGAVLDALAGEVGGASLRRLEDDGGLLVAGGLEGAVARVRFLELHLGGKGSRTQLRCSVGAHVSWRRLDMEREGEDVRWR